MTEKVFIAKIDLRTFEATHWDEKAFGKCTSAAYARN